MRATPMRASAEVGGVLPVAMTLIGSAQPAQTRAIRSGATRPGTKNPSAPACA